MAQFLNQGILFVHIPKPGFGKNSSVAPSPPDYNQGHEHNKLVMYASKTDWEKKKFKIQTMFVINFIPDLNIIL